MRTTAIAFLLLGLTATAQSPPKAVDVTRLAMEAALKGAKPDAPLSDLPMRVVDVGGEHVGVAIVRRTRAEVNALIHDKITEVYVIRDGSGTMVTGGTLVDRTETTASDVIGPSSRGSRIEGGTSRRVTPGDVIVLPPGTAHMFTQLDGTITYVTIRIDPNRVTALK
jgi:mannose-6-phosphate isomerase-like protein (cupin superfamily)